MIPRQVLERSLQASRCCLLLAAVLVLAGGCERFSRELQAGSYRATLALPGGELPFGFDVAREENGFVGYLINGDERVPVPLAVAGDGAVSGTVLGFETTLTARVAGRRLAGQVTFTRPGGATQSVAFAAELGPTWRFYEQPRTDNADVSGRWDVRFTNDAGSVMHGVAEFSQSFERVTGTVLLATGDQRYLAGEVHGEDLRLSRFDGGSAYLYHASIDERGALIGEYWSGTTGHQRFDAKRDPDAEIDWATVATGLHDPNARLDFTFPDPEGEPVSLSDPRFAGKVVIVAIAGSWCANCHDEARLLMEFYRRYRPQGLEIVSLMFEHHGDFAGAAAATRRFRDGLGITYPTLIAGTSDQQDAATRLPQLTGVHAYPTTLFLDRSGKVRRIHAGFAGPATGEHHAELVREFTELTQQLLAESTAAGRAVDAPGGRL